ncbi:TetR/AcrR family transcriptional regulator [Rhizobium calliandrae]|uniref:TetR/AcrR family transcriptional regulator n=1 Tax=Rhizobium calliandrae TaxID=1312182 RepID=A0ABT7K838_9HYPH|nr:TetR/AcrR family transcriptional regulator [Rhizobium calliandrae]MDL2404752.1 TetR/AcrR family transcriptional regulator [Rhizobium calliandrae]
MTTTPSASASEELEQQGRSAQKRRAILDAATGVFLQKGYLATNMDEIAALAAVSKQTVYKNFPGKETLFVEIVSSVTSRTGDRVHNEMPDLADGEDVAEYLQRYAYRQLTIVLTPRVMQLRRLVIGEVGRFPDLAKALFDGGPKRAMAAMAALFVRLADRGLLAIDDPAVAASQFNWLIMGEPLNRAMLLGDDAIPKPAELRRHAAAGVRVFLASYGK